MAELNRGFIPSFRKLGDLTIYFASKYKIYAWDNSSSILIYRAEDRGKGYYRYNWKPLLDRLYHNNSLSGTYDVARIAQRFDIDLFCPRGRPPDIPPCTLERPSNFKRGLTMGIFRPTDTHDYDIVVYSKYCIRCDEQEAGQLIELDTWALHNDLNVIVIRTGYRPADHNRATEIYGSPDYPTFVVYHDVKTLKEFVDMISNTKNKMVKKGKTKGGNRDLQGLPKAKNIRREDSGAGAVSEVKNEDKR